MGYNEQFLILDGGEKKHIPHVYMTKIYLSERCRKKNTRTLKREEWDDKLGEMKTIYVENKDYKPYTKRIEYAVNKYTEYQQEWNWILWPRGPKYDQMENMFRSWATDKEIYNYLGWKPFEPWVMLNISPNWNEKITKGNCVKLKNMFEKYLKENWYSEWKYVLEAGGNGDHLHLHAVCKLNTERLKSCRTHLNDNWKRQLIKYAQTEGLEGFICRPGLQRILIQGEEMGRIILKDKMDYLIEEKKPQGHKNKTPNALKRWLGVVWEGNLITVK